MSEFSETILEISNSFRPLNARQRTATLIATDARYRYVVCSNDLRHPVEIWMQLVKYSIDSNIGLGTWSFFSKAVR